MNMGPTAAALVTQRSDSVSRRRWRKAKRSPDAFGKKAAPMLALVHS